MSRLVVGGVALLGGALLLGAYQAGARQAAAADYRVRTETLRVAIAQRETVYTRDTVVFWRLKRQVDTLLQPIAIPLLAADSSRADAALRVSSQTVAACSQTVLTCEARLAAERQLRVAAEASAAVVGLGAPPPGSHWGLLPVAVLVGVLAGAWLAR